MLIHQSKKKQKFLEDIWGSSCPECGANCSANLQLFSSEKEDIIILDCPVCEFTIVVVELEKMLDKEENSGYRSLASSSAV